MYSLALSDRADSHIVHNYSSLCEPEAELALMRQSKQLLVVIPTLCRFLNHYRGISSFISQVKVASVRDVICICEAKVSQCLHVFRYDLGESLLMDTLDEIV